MNRNILALSLFSVLSLSLISCSSVSQFKLPVALDKTPQRFRVKLETKAQILTFQALDKTTVCDRFKGRLKTTVKNPAGKKFVAEGSCTLVPGALALQTKEILPKGEYEVNVDAALPEELADAPVVTVKCLDADANSGPEQDFEGAQDLAENQAVKGTLNYTAANSTRWVQLKAKGEVSLYFLPESPDDVHATLFVLPKGAKNPKKIGVLPPKIKKRLRPDGTLYVQIAAAKYSGEVAFHLSRKDLAATKTVRVPVIDCFALNSRTSVVLLKPSDALKMNDELHISAQRTNGKPVELGKCVVNSVSQSQVSCRMESVAGEELTHYTAVLEKEGNQS